MLQLFMMFFGASFVFIFHTQIHLIPPKYLCFSYKLYLFNFLISTKKKKEEKSVLNLRSFRIYAVYPYVSMDEKKN